MSIISVMEKVDFKLKKRNKKHPFGCFFYLKNIFQIIHKRGILHLHKIGDDAMRQPEEIPDNYIEVAEEDIGQLRGEFFSNVRDVIEKTFERSAKLFLQQYPECTLGVVSGMSVVFWTIDKNIVDEYEPPEMYDCTALIAAIQLLERFLVLGEKPDKYIRTNLYNKSDLGE